MVKTFGNSKLIKARVLMFRREAGGILEKYYAGKLNKDKAKSELMKLLDR